MKIIKNIVEIYSENIQILIITIILIILCILLKIIIFSINFPTFLCKPLHFVIKVL